MPYNAPIAANLTESNFIVRIIQVTNPRTTITARIPAPSPNSVAVEIISDIPPNVLLIHSKNKTANWTERLNPIIKEDK